MHIPQQRSFEVLCNNFLFNKCQRLVWVRQRAGRQAEQHSPAAATDSNSSFIVKPHLATSEGNFKRKNVASNKSLKEILPKKKRNIIL